jgi:predicted RNA-binding protein
MCEFTVFLDKSIVFRDAVYAKLEEGKLLLKDVLGASKTVENCKIVEVDVHSERLVLSSL